MEIFILAMSLYPDVQKKAQSAILEVVGRDRLPDITDRKALVYVDAIIKECLRWFPLAPLGVAHSTIEDDEFRGYFIPAGTVIMPNVWCVDKSLLKCASNVRHLTTVSRACMFDPDVYEDPEVFRPERFIRDGMLDSNVCDRIDFIFGFGRR